MKFDDYSINLAKCLLSDKKIDCVYLFYATDNANYSVNSSLKAKGISDVCTSTTNVYRSKSVACSEVSGEGITLTVTSKNGESLGSSSPEFNAGVYIYGVAAVVSDDTKTEGVYTRDGLLFYNEISPVVVPAGSDIAMTINIDLMEA